MCSPISTDKGLVEPLVFVIELVMVEYVLPVSNTVHYLLVMIT